MIVHKAKILINDKNVFGKVNVTCNEVGQIGQKPQVELVVKNSKPPIRDGV